MARIPFCTTFTQNSIFIKPATTKSYRAINGKVVIFKDKDNNNNLMYGKLVSIGLHFCTFLYNCLLMRVCDDVIQIALLHFTTNNTDITLKIIKRRKKVAKLFRIPFLCCIFVVSERDINNQINKLQIMTTIDLKTALEMQDSFLKSVDKKRLGITGYQLLRDWYVDSETNLAYKISSYSETGSNIDKHIEDIFAWIPKSQTKVFQYKNEFDETCKLIFIKTWLYNKNKSTYEVSRFKNFAY